MAVPTSPAYPVSYDNWSPTDGQLKTLTLQAAEHASLHARTLDALVATQQMVGLESHYPGRGTDSVLLLLSRMRKDIDLIKVGGDIKNLDNVTITNANLVDPVMNKLAVKGKKTILTGDPADDGAVLASNGNLRISADGTLKIGPYRANTTPSESNPYLTLVHTNSTWTLLPYDYTPSSNAAAAVVHVSYDATKKWTTMNVGGDLALRDTAHLTLGGNASNNLHAVPLQQVAYMLLGKQDKPSTGRAMLTWDTATQSMHPVTVWGEVHNIQLQWVKHPYSQVDGAIRVHLDARIGSPGQGGVVGAGALYWDLAKAAPNDPRTLGGQAVNADTAVMATTANNITLHAPAPGYTVHVGVGTSDIGQMAIASNSSRQFKNPLGNITMASYSAFFDAVSPVHFVYKPNAGAAYAGTEHYGFIAEDVETAAHACGMPSGVVTYEVGSGGQNIAPKGLETKDLIAVLWSVTKDLRAEVAALNARLVELQAQTQTP